MKAPEKISSISALRQFLGLKKTSKKKDCAGGKWFRASLN